LFSSGEKIARNLVKNFKKKGNLSVHVVVLKITGTFADYNFGVHVSLL